MRMLYRSLDIDIINEKRKNTVLRCRLNIILDYLFKIIYDYINFFFCQAEKKNGNGNCITVGRNDRHRTIFTFLIF